MGMQIGLLSIISRSNTAQLSGTCSVTLNPISNLLQSIERLGSTRNDLSDFLSRDRTNRLTGIVTDKSIDGGLFSLAVNQALKCSSQIVICDLSSLSVDAKICFWILSFFTLKSYHSKNQKNY